jgi:hypothetical protein
MTLKQFLKPDWRKIVVFITVLILGGLSLFIVAVCFSCPIYIGFIGLALFIVLDFIFLIFSPSFFFYLGILLSIFYWYLLSCLIIWIYSNFKSIKKFFKLNLRKFIIVIIFLVLLFIVVNIINAINQQGSCGDFRKLLAIKNNSAILLFINRSCSQENSGFSGGDEPSFMVYNIFDDATANVTINNTYLIVKNGDFYEFPVRFYNKNMNIKRGLFIGKITNCVQVYDALMIPENETYVEMAMEEGSSLRVVKVYDEYVILYSTFSCGSPLCVPSKHEEKTMKVSLDGKCELLERK